jgi:hypothetical protein
MLLEIIYDLQQWRNLLMKILSKWSYQDSSMIRILESRFFHGIQNIKHENYPDCR